MVKVVTLLLVALAVLAIVGRLRFAGRGQRRSGAVRCLACGRPRIGTAPCSCGGKSG